MKKVAGNVYVCTDDGSYGFKGLVTNKLKELVKNEGKKYDLVIAIGPMIMMKFVCMLTKELEYTNYCKFKSYYGRWYRNVWSL